MYIKQEKLVIVFLSLLGLSFLVFGAPTDEVPMSILEIENQPPNVTEVRLYDNSSAQDDELLLRVNNKTNMWCSGYAFDIDGYGDLDQAWAKMWHTGMSSYDASDDNRWHYTNNSCNITEITGDPGINAEINCTFQPWFYANYSEWNCTIFVNDSMNYTANDSDNATMLPLLGVDVVNDSVDWGVISVDTPYSTDLNVTVQNTGNTPLEFQIDAYNDTGIGRTSDYAFDCDIGHIATDAIVYNDTYGSPYAQSTNFDTTNFINTTDFYFLPQTFGTLPSNKSTYFGIQIPGWPTINGSCTGYLRYDAIDGRR